MAEFPKGSMDGFSNIKPYEEKQRMSFSDIPRDVIMRYVLEWAESLGYDVSGLNFRQKQGKDGITARIYEQDDKPRQPSSVLNIYFDGLPSACIYSHKSKEIQKWSAARETRLQGANVPYKNEGYFSLPSGTSQPKQTVQPVQAECVHVNVQPEKPKTELIEAMNALYEEARSIGVREQLNDYYQSSGAKYLLRKSVFFTALRHDKALRIAQTTDKYNGALLVPFFDIETNSKLITIQRIRHDWNIKPWLEGLGVPAGRAWHLIGGTCKDKIMPLILCEGLATGLSVYLHYKTLYPVAVCGDCNSLKQTGLKLLQLRPNDKIYIAADNDIKTYKERGFNPGMDAALAVKAAAPDRVFISCPKSENGENVDWNDIYKGE